MAAATIPAQVLETLARRYAPHLRIVTHAKQSRLRRGAAIGLRRRPQGIRVLHRWRRPVRPGRVAVAAGAHGAEDGPGERIQDRTQRPGSPRVDRRRFTIFARVCCSASGSATWIAISASSAARCSEGISLTSTSGTICVELVRKLEQTGCEVEEAPVHHFARAHGQSQFFRAASAACDVRTTLPALAADVASR